MDLQEIWKLHREAVRVIESSKYNDDEKEQLLNDLYRQLTEHHGVLPTKPKKPGRKGSKIRDAYNAITTEPQSFEDLLKTFDVSINTMRQHGRFDPFPERGKIHTKTIAGSTLIWREPH